MQKDSGENNLSDAKLNYIRRNLIGNNVLDAGAGYCYYSEWLVNNKPNLNVVCIDKLELPNQNGNGKFRLYLRCAVLLLNLHPAY